MRPTAAHPPFRLASQRRVVVAAKGEAWPSAFRSKRVLWRSCTPSRRRARGPNRQHTELDERRTAQDILQHPQRRPPPSQRAACSPKAATSRARPSGSGRLLVLLQERLPLYTPNGSGWEALQQVRQLLSHLTFTVSTDSFEGRPTPASEWLVRIRSEEALHQTYLN